MLGFGKNSWAPRLGGLELKVMEIAWRGTATTVREFVDACDNHDMATSTMQTTLERLHKKGLLSRAKHGRAYAYTAALAREDLITLALRDLSQDVATGRMEPLVAGFLGLVRHLDPEAKRTLRHNVLRELEAGLGD